MPRKLTASTGKEHGDRTKSKGTVMHIKELCEHMEMETTISDLTEKKLFSYMHSDASAVTAEKIRSIVAIETGFPSIITI